MSGGYKFDPQAAKLVQQGLKAATAELEDTGFFSINAQQGQGFQFLQMSGMEMGNGELASVFGQFCGRWGMAINGKMQDLNDIAERLGLSAGLYHEQEQYVNDTLKEAVVTSSSYNPQQGLAEGENAGEKSWGEVWGDVKPRAPEFDASMPDMDEMGDQWGQVGDDFGDSPWQDVAGPDRWDDSDWQWDGPPPEQGQGGQGNDRGDGGN
ncbi:hypothetical protein H181DRAFT_02800 [Streptomyces sp. WMMB 714]|uniref:hypothetical protein n=1 Tax=Streptomyces sp. WMMB 714 TaxID=1286822 RepID=UPI0006987C36|nr:hypothetical protein [Streptomyces sp. WMMB 714]SCK33980.1 hypothetical protein H181DRAFT_02800 [Streptomyces sp. WMMB 714]